jgi:hypothetical protein
LVEVIEIDKLQCSWILYKYHAVIHKFSGTYKQLSTSHGKNQAYTIVKQWIEEKKHNGTISYMMIVNQVMKYIALLNMNYLPFVDS